MSTGPVSPGGKGKGEKKKKLIWSEPKLLVFYNIGIPTETELNHRLEIQVWKYAGETKKQIIPSQSNLFHSYEFYILPH